MKKFAFAALAAFVALFATLFLHNPAQAYPDVQASLSASDHDLVSGEEFAVTASSSAECNWSLDWDGTNRAVRGTQFQTKFVAPEVTKVTTVPLTGVCNYTDPGSRAAAESTITPDELFFTVRPATSPINAGASLAGTGGPNRMVLASGFLLLFVGATVAMVARRRAERAELAEHVEQRELATQTV